MPSGPRPTSRPGAGPGRGNPRARTQAPKTPAGKAPAKTPAGKVSQQAGQPTPAELGADATAAADAPVEAVAAAKVRKRSSLTTRAIALAVVVLILTISYASSLRIYVAQQQDIAVTKLAITEHQQRISELEDEIARWDDPAYVKSQTRQRLGWVVPGETGYKVIGPDGKPLGGGAEISPQTEKTEAPKDAWWAGLWGSVKAADDLAPEPRPTKEPTITVDSTPSPSPTR